MPKSTVAFLIIALIAAFIGFAGVEGYSWDGARTICYIFLAFALLSFLGRLFGRQSA